MGTVHAAQRLREFGKGALIIAQNRAITEDTHGQPRTETYDKNEVAHDSPMEIVLLENHLACPQSEEQRFFPRMPPHPTPGRDGYQQCPGIFEDDPWDQIGR